MAILPFRKQKISTNGIKPSLTQEELAELAEEAEAWKFGLNRQCDLNTPSGVFLSPSAF